MPSAGGAARPPLSHHLPPGPVAEPPALAVEAAGGRASPGRERILDVVATGFHPRVSLWVGRPDEVARAESLHWRSPA
jgi:fructose-1,6-bisphosphatase